MNYRLVKTRLSRRIDYVPVVKSNGLLKSKILGLGYVAIGSYGLFAIYQSPDQILNLIRELRMEGN
jgi:hypothetical protein